MSAIGAAGAASNQASMYAYQAAVAQVQEKEAEEGAWASYSQGEAQAEQAGLQGAQQIGQIKASQGASGLAVGGTGAGATSVYGQNSSTAVVQSAAEIDMMNELNIRYNAGLKGWQQLADATNFANQAGIDLYASSLAKASEMPQILSSLVGGFTGAAKNFGQASLYGADAGATGFSFGIG